MRDTNFASSTLYILSSEDKERREEEGEIGLGKAIEETERRGEKIFRCHHKDVILVSLTFQ